jgi:hypothetical protein
MADEKPMLAVFRGRCGHEWIASIEGSYACPVCGEWDGDHHLLGWEQYPVQPSGWGFFEQLAELEDEAWKAEQLAATEAKGHA